MYKLKDVHKLKVIHNTHPRKSKRLIARLDKNIVESGPSNSERFSLPFLSGELNSALGIPIKVPNYPESYWVLQSSSFYFIIQCYDFDNRFNSYFRYLWVVKRNSLFNSTSFITAARIATKVIREANIFLIPGVVEHEE